MYFAEFIYHDDCRLKSHRSFLYCISGSLRCNFLQPIWKLSSSSRQCRIIFRTDRGFAILWQHLKVRVTRSIGHAWIETDFADTRILNAVNKKGQRVPKHTYDGLSVRGGVAFLQAVLIFLHESQHQLAQRCNSVLGHRPWKPRQDGCIRAFGQSICFIEREMKSRVLWRQTCPSSTTASPLRRYTTFCVVRFRLCLHLSRSCTASEVH